MIGLSKHIEILLLSNDCVIVPGFGGFMSHHVEARRDAGDGSFLPPIRSIGFNPKLTLNDSLLAQSYVETYDISYPDAVKRLDDEVRELSQRIETEGFYVFKGIGKVSLNEEGNLEFAPCEAGLLTPSLYGLASFQMKTVAELKDAGKVACGALRAEPLLQETQQEDDARLRTTARFVALWRNVAVACIAVILFLVIPTPLVNNAQLTGASIDTSLLVRVMPKDMTTGEPQVTKAISQTKIAAEETAKTDLKEAEEDKSESHSACHYSIVLASRVTLANATEYVQSLKRRGYKDAFVYHKNHVKVLYGRYDSREDASKAMGSMRGREEFANAWIIEVKQ